MDPLYTKLIVEMSVELPFVIFSVAVLRCVIAKYRCGSTGFATDFFLLYIIQSTVDLTDYFVVRQD